MDTRNIIFLVTFHAQEIANSPEILTWGSRRRHQSPSLPWDPRMSDGVQNLCDGCIRQRETLKIHIQTRNKLWSAILLSSSETGAERVHFMLEIA